MKRSARPTASPSQNAALPPKNRPSAGGRTATAPDLTRLEFHRHAVALMPDPADKRPGAAVMVLARESARAFRGCSCDRTRGRTCPHLLELAAIVRRLARPDGSLILGQDFETSVWHRLATLFCEHDRLALEKTQIVSREAKNASVPVLIDDRNEEMLVYLSAGDDRKRFLERCTGSTADPSATRSRVLRELLLHTRTPDERALMEKGVRTRRQAFEESVWYRVAYHIHREFGLRSVTLSADMRQQTGRYEIILQNADGAGLLRLVVPRKAVTRVLADTQIPLDTRNRLSIGARPLTPMLDIRCDARGALVLKPLFRCDPEDGSPQFLTWNQREKHRCGNLTHLPGTDTLVPLVAGDRLFAAFGSQARTVIGRAKIPQFLAEYGDLLAAGTHRVDAAVRNLPLYRRPERVQIAPEALERDWYYLSVSYGFGDALVSLNDLLRARRTGERFLPAGDGWVDTHAPGLEGVDLLDWEPSDDGDAPQAFNRLDVFRLLAVADAEVEIAGRQPGAGEVRRLLDAVPGRPLPAADPLTAPLRGYQQKGLEWLWFLAENRLGGLLCDDMGLGKTHQVMALMQAFQQIGRRPMLVVCPTTVISHWERKLAEHAAHLRVAVHHGSDRDVDATANDGDVVITSYGVLLRDCEALARVPFVLAVFDEIQYIKNPATKSYRAARRLPAAFKLGLTGTPIENTLWELKALMDLVAPGYLGPDGAFETRYVRPVEADPASPRRAELQRLIHPFTLRRLKAAVLDELPPKIEDLRVCRLSDDQVDLYRQAVQDRGRPLIEQLHDAGTDVPYIHIFALLTLLKQICNHPALVRKKPAEYERWQSGKWDLFREVLAESLDSGQKVVVYSQFLDMLAIIADHLKHHRIEAAVLTGQSRDRGRIIERFNTDPACRVFLGSLRAGGTGIDLVAGSVVIHYDRWWNAAREDQATDRVHRIGQRRGVQVFKLVTEGTLEEKIAAIIDKKRRLMNAVVQEEDPDTLKVFTRRQLMELLAVPE